MIWLIGHTPSLGILTTLDHNNISWHSCSAHIVRLVCKMLLIHSCIGTLDPQLTVLLGTIMKPLESRALLRKECPWRQDLELSGFGHACRALDVHSVSWVLMQRCHMTLCSWILSSMMDSIPLELKTKINCFSDKLLFVRIFYHNRRNWCMTVHSTDTWQDLRAPLKTNTLSLFISAAIYWAD